MAESSSSSSSSCTWYNYNKEWVVDVCAGWISGAVAIVTLQPLDTILTRWQASTVGVVGPSHRVTMPTPATTATAAAAAVAAPLSSVHVPSTTSLSTQQLPRTASMTTVSSLSSYSATHSIPHPTATTAITTPHYAAAISNNWRVQTHQLVSSHGWRALWRGAGPMLAVVPLQNGLLMAGYGYGTRCMEPTSHNGGTTTTTSDDTQRQQRRSTQLMAIMVGGCTGGTKRVSVCVRKQMCGCNCTKCIPRTMVSFPAYL
jgi:Mitochondrial carrier protein